MGSQYAMSARDNRTRAGAKDPWGREAWPLAQRHADAPLGQDSEPGLLVGSGRVRRVMTNGALGGEQAGCRRSLFVARRVGRSHLIGWP